MTKTISIWIGVFAVTFLALFFLIKYAQPVDQNQVFPEINVVRAEDNTIGDRNSKTILVEYSDFQCPGCAQYHPLLKRLIEEEGANFIFVYRDFPLSQHKHAVNAARFAEAAGFQEKFWEMHGMIFENQSAWKGLDDATPEFLKYAQDIGLDLDKLQADMNSEAVAQRIQIDQNDAQRLNLGQTPTFFLNGKMITPRSYDEFKSLVQNAAGS